MTFHFITVAFRAILNLASVSLFGPNFSQSSAGSQPTRPSCHFFNTHPASHHCPLDQAERASSDICASRPVLLSRNPLPNPEKNNVRIPRMGSSTFLEVAGHVLLPTWLPNGTIHFPDLLPVYHLLEEEHCILFYFTLRIVRVT